MPTCQKGLVKTTNDFHVLTSPSAYLAIRTLTTGQKVLSSNPNAGMKVCSSWDSTLNGVFGLFTLRVQTMIRALNKPSKPCSELPHDQNYFIL